MQSSGVFADIHVHVDKIKSNTKKKLTSESINEIEFVKVVCLRVMEEGTLMGMVKTPKLIVYRNKIMRIILGRQTSMN